MWEHCECTANEKPLQLIHLEATSFRIWMYCLQFIHFVIHIAKFGLGNVLALLNPKFFLYISKIDNKGFHS